MNEYFKFISKTQFGVKSFLEKQNFGIIDTHASFHKQGHILTRRLWKIWLDFKKGVDFAMNDKVHREKFNELFSKIYS